MHIFCKVSIQSSTGKGTRSIDFIYLQTLRPTVTAVRNVIDKSLAERDANIDKMCTHIDKDIVTLGKEVKEVKQKAQVYTACTYNHIEYYVTAIYSVPLNYSNMTIIFYGLLRL